jgi:hypothetical protein
MGLADAIRARLALARGESMGETFRIMFASKTERRKIAARKFPGRSVPGGPERRSSPVAAEGDAGAFLDAAWYATAHGIPAEDAEAHFRARGLIAGFAPRAALAGVDGRRLSGRGAELLARCGVALGAVAGEPGAAGEDPWAIRNPEGKALAVVTAIAEPGRRLLPLAPEWAARADFFALTDLEFAEHGLWRPVRPVFHHLEPERVVAFAQAHLHAFFAAYPRVLWVDPGVLCCSDPAALAVGAPLAAFRDEARTLGAALAAGGAASADVLGEVAGHVAFGQPGVFDPSVLLIDPSDAAVARFMSRWWRHAVRGPAVGGFAFTLAAAEMPDVTIGALPGLSLDRSPDFLRVPA